MRNFQKRRLIDSRVWRWLFDGFRRVNRHHVELLQKTHRSLRRSLELDQTVSEMGILPARISASENEFAIGEFAVDEKPIVHEHCGCFNGLILDGLHSSVSSTYH
jgi:CRP-like cAMP-binding protein